MPHPSIDRRMQRTARVLARRHVDPETGEIMSLRIKQNGQRMSGADIARAWNSGRAAADAKLGAGEFAAFQAKRAACACGGPRPPITVDMTDVPVTYRKRRGVATPVAA